MARRSGHTPKCVEEKRRQLPIYQHYTLSPGKTKSHHPEAKCIHCQKEFVCGSKQRLIRHVRKCNSIPNPEQIIAETLNTLARNSATGQLNHSILEASNLLPSQISQIQHSATQQLVGQAINSAANSPTVTTANSISNNLHGSGLSQHGGDHAVTASSSNGLATSSNAKRKVQKRGRKPGIPNSNGPGIHVTTGMDGKTHFLPASQLPQGSVQSSTQMVTQQRHNGRGGQLSYPYPASGALNSASSTTASGAHINASNSGHLPCATQTHHHSSLFKLNSELMDKAYLKLVLTRNLPLSLCDTKEFQAWVKTFANDYKPPSSINLIAQNLKNEAQVARYRASNILAKAPKKTVNLELHYWPDEVRGHLWYALVAGIDSKRLLISVKDIQRPTNQRAPSQTTVNVSADKLLTQFIDENIKRVGSDRINSLMLTSRKDADTIVDHVRQSLYTSHPSIVSYHCWWNHTNSLCSDTVEVDETFRTCLRNSSLMIQFINKQPQLRSHLEKFSPFAGLSGSLYRKKDINRWYTHLVSYLLEYIKNNRETITRILENYSPAKLSPSSDTNNNSNNSNNSTSTDNTAQSNAQQHQSSGTQSNGSHGGIYSDGDPQASEVKSIVISSEYWANLNSALVYLRSFRDIVALAPMNTTSLSGSNQQNGSNGHISDNSNVQVTPVISPVTSNNLSLSEYMSWYLKYGKSLVLDWGQSPNTIKYQLIGCYLQRFNSTINQFKLLFAAYLLNPKYRCAFMTQRAKDSAIEEILNIASEFMPEESDGHTIFDQWKLYLIREEPYDMVYDEHKSSPLEWWMSLPCAESIRRVALRILRLRAFSSPRPETLFAPLYFYEDETRVVLPESTYEDLALLRYYYDHEDKIGQTGCHGAVNSSAINVICDRTQVGYVHNSYTAETDDTTKLLPSGPMEGNGAITNGLSDEAMAIDGYDEIANGGYMSNVDRVYKNNASNPNNATISVLDNLPGYKQFCAYIDFNDSGIQVVEEPIEKKNKRKWTAQEILSRCQSNHHSGATNNNNNNHEAAAVQQK